MSELGFSPLSVPYRPERRLWHYEDICSQPRGAGTSDLHMKHLPPPAGLQTHRHKSTINDPKTHKGATVPAADLPRVIVCSVSAEQLARAFHRYRISITDRMHRSLVRLLLLSFSAWSHVRPCMSCLLRQQAKLPRNTLTLFMENSSIWLLLRLKSRRTSLNTDTAPCRSPVAP